MPKMYVLVRKELDPMYRGVQGTHAVARYALEYPEKLKEWNNEDLIFLGVRFPTGIERWADKLDEKGLLYSVFYEPDLRDEPTALACYCTGEIFRSLPTA